MQKLHPWRTSNGKNWVEHDPNGKLILFPSNGSLKCLAESAQSPGSSFTKCVFDQADVDETLAQLGYAVRNADPKKVNHFLFACSLGGPIDKDLFAQFLGDVKTKHVDSLKVVWKTSAQMIEVYEQWEWTDNPYF